MGSTNLPLPLDWHFLTLQTFREETAVLTTFSKSICKQMPSKTAVLYKAYVESAVDRDEGTAVNRVGGVAYLHVLQNCGRVCVQIIHFLMMTSKGTQKTHSTP